MTLQDAILDCLTNSVGSWSTDWQLLAGCQRLMHTRPELRDLWKELTNLVQSGQIQQRTWQGTPEWRMR